jgi:hypothetical protein
VFPRIHKDFTEKSSIPRRSAAGRFIPKLVMVHAHFRRFGFEQFAVLGKGKRRSQFNALKFFWAKP